MAFSLVLSDGSRSMELVNGTGTGVWLGLNPDLPVPAVENTYAETPESEGRRRVRTRPQNPEGRLPLFIGASDGETFRGYIDELQELVASAHRRAPKGVSTLTYTPDGGGAITYVLESINLTTLPQNAVLMRQFVCEAEIAFECRPYGRLEEVTLLTDAELDGPVDWFEVEDVPGHVPALGKLVITEASSQGRDHVEVGLEHGDEYVTGTAIVIDSDDFTNASGSTGSDADAYDPAGATTNNVITATLDDDGVTLCSVALTHIGRKRIKARVKASETTAFVRLKWKVGNGSYSYSPWRRVPDDDNFYELYLGTITVDEVPEGTHGWTAYIEGRDSAAGTLSFDAMYVLPAQVWCQARSGGSGRDALASGQTIEFRHDTVLTESATGTYGRSAVVEGDYLLIPPATRANRVSRIAVKARRADVDNDQVDSGLSDSLTATLTVTPRVLLTGGAGEPTSEVVLI